jgi:hypothetical protein
LSINASALAPPPFEPLEIDIMSKIIRSFVAMALPLAAGAFATPSVMAAALKLDVVVDTTVCATVPVQCSGPGHTFEQARSSNHNPIALRVTVNNKNGLPVNGLGAVNFTFTNPIMPAGGSSAVTCSVADCGASTFIAAGNGLYQIYLDRGTAGNWTQGGYAATLEVAAGVNDGLSLVSFNIPN